MYFIIYLLLICSCLMLPAAFYAYEFISIIKFYIALFYIIVAYFCTLTWKI